MKILSRYFRFTLPPLSIYLDRRDQSRTDGLCRATQRPNPSPLWCLPPRRRFEKIEKAALKALPSVEYDGGGMEDCEAAIPTVTSPSMAITTVPRISTAAKACESSSPRYNVEIFLNLERLAIHPRCRLKVGQRIKILAHFPANSVAFYEAIPQKLLSQSRFIHPDLNTLFLEASSTRADVSRPYPSRHGSGLRVHQGNQSLRPCPGERAHRRCHRHHASLQPHPHPVLSRSCSSRHANSP